MSIPYNILLKAKTGNFCCVKGKDGKDGNDGKDGKDGHCDLSAVRGVEPSPVLENNLYYDSSSFSIVHQHLGNGYNIVNTKPDDVGLYFLPFGGDIANNRPVGLQRFNHSSWLKVLPDWTDISNHQNSNKKAIPSTLDEQQNIYDYVPMYWHYNQPEQQ